jgi:hypothetical protein
VTSEDFHSQTTVRPLTLEETKREADARCAELVRVATNLLGNGALGEAMAVFEVADKRARTPAAVARLERLVARAEAMVDATIQAQAARADAIDAEADELEHMDEATAHAVRRYAAALRKGPITRVSMPAARVRLLQRRPTRAARPVRRSRPGSRRRGRRVVARRTSRGSPPQANDGGPPNLAARRARTFRHEPWYRALTDEGAS